MTAAGHYREMIAAIDEQSARLRDIEADRTRWNSAPRRFRLDPRRELDPNTAALVDLVEADDAVVDVGGGAGRVSLPMALKCREVIDVDPSPGMLAAFRECAEEAGIKNARAVQAEWMSGHGMVGDVVMTCNVTYFVADIVPFIEKMAASARRRVAITVWSVAPPNRDAAIFEAAFGEPQAPYPSYRELLPVLWEMGLLPDVRVLPQPFLLRPAASKTMSEAIELWLHETDPKDVAGARARLEARAEELFVDDKGFRPRTRPDMRELLITWETGA